MKRKKTEMIVYSICNPKWPIKMKHFHIIWYILGEIYIDQVKSQYI